jgi:membrane protease subunit HflC
MPTYDPEDIVAELRKRAGALGSRRIIVQEIRGKADAEATRVYGTAYSADPEFYAFSRTLEAYKEGQNKNSVVILTTDSDYYRYLKQSGGTAAARPAR